MESMFTGPSLGGLTARGSRDAVPVLSMWVMYQSMVWYIRLFDWSTFKEWEVSVSMSKRIFRNSSRLFNSLIFFIFIFISIFDYIYEWCHVLWLNSLFEISPIIFQVLENGEGCTRKSLNENAALLENPESYRLSCITNVYEDVVLEVQGPVGEAAAQIKALAK